MKAFALRAPNGALMLTCIMLLYFSINVSAPGAAYGSSSGSTLGSVFHGAEPTNGWRAVGPPERRFGRHVPDGRYFEIGVRGCERISNGEKGVILSVYRPNRPPHRVVVAEKNLPEYSSQAVLLNRSFHLRGWQRWNDLRGLWDWIQDAAGWAKDKAGFIEDVAKELKDVWDAAAEIIASVKVILEMFDDASGQIAEKLESRTDARSVHRYAESIHIENVSHGNATVPRRMYNALRRTGNTKARILGLAEGIMSIPN